ncbi:hypothetical protein Tco_0826568 [Tanacetum coccineum]
MIRTRSRKETKRKDQEATEAWMNTPITFPPISLKDVSDESLIKEVEVEGYLVRRVYVDEGASVEVMAKNVTGCTFHHSFNDEILYTKGNSYFGCPFNNYLRVLEVGEEAGGLSEACKCQLKLLLKDNMKIFA